MDLYARFVVGWAMSAVNDRHLTMATLVAALKRRRPDVGLLHQSDRGSTYTCEDYRQLLAEHGIVCSMSRTGNCYDNAAMELELDLRARDKILVLADGVAGTWPRRNGDLADLLRRAASSSSFNVANGLSELAAADKARF